MRPIPYDYHLVMVAAKFGAAAGLAVTLAQWWVPKDVLSAAFVACMCLQVTLVSAFRIGLEQVLASALGAVSTIAYLLLFPITPWTTGAAVATTYAVATYLRWGYPALVVALFSSLYMTLLAQDTPLDTAILRFQSVLLGVGAALVVNWAFSPISYKVNLRMRLHHSLDIARKPLQLVREALASHSVSGLDGALAAFGPAFRQLADQQGVFEDMRREFQLQRRPGGLRLSEVYLGERTVRELELVLHHAHDVAMASLRLKMTAGPQDKSALFERAAESMVQALEELEAVGASRFHDAELGAEGALAALQPLVSDPCQGAPRHPDEDYTVWLALSLALVQVHEHLGELARLMAKLGRSEDPARAV